MKQFLYLDDDRINSIIAQNEKGLVGSMTTEKDDEHGKERSKTLDIETKGEAGANIFKLAKAEAALSIGMEFQGTKREQTTTREIIEKTLHDAAFDIAYEAIKLVAIKLDTISVNIGDYVEVVRTFDFVDLDYLERIFSKGGITDYLKKTEKERIKKEFEEIKNEELNREQRRKGSGALNNNLKELLMQSDKRFDDLYELVMALEKVLPYKRLIVSADGYIVPLEDQYFRINPNSLGFMYGGEIKCVGLITNVIGNTTNLNSDDNIFASLQSIVNETLRNILPTNSDKLYVVSPLAIYYEH